MREKSMTFPAVLFPGTTLYSFVCDGRRGDGTQTFHCREQVAIAGVAMSASNRWYKSFAVTYIPSEKNRALAAENVEERAAWLEEVLRPAKIKRRLGTLRGQVLVLKGEVRLEQVRLVGFSFKTKPTHNNVGRAQYHTMATLVRLANTSAWRRGKSFKLWGPTTREEWAQVSRHTMLQPLRRDGRNIHDAIQEVMQGLLRPEAEALDDMAPYVNGSGSFLTSMTYMRRRGGR